MCNLYSITTNQAAISTLFRVVNRYVGNLAPMPGVFPDYKAPIVRTGADGRELATARWGMSDMASVMPTQSRASLAVIEMSSPDQAGAMARRPERGYPPRIGRQRMRPALFTVRDRGASLSKAKCVRVSL
jgi:putative SOS response-associated peptidase YedK